MIQTLNMWANELDLNEVNCFINNENELWPIKHNHTYYEFMLIERGSLLQTIDDKDTILRKNDVCILHPDTVHLIKKNSNDLVILLNFEVHVNFIKQLTKTLGVDIDSVLSKDNAVFFKCSEHDIHNYMQSITTAFNIKDTNQSQLCLKNIITHLFTNLVNYHFFNTVDINDNSIISSILIELNNPANFSLSIEQICRKKHYSHEHVSRLFKKANLAPPNKVLLKNKLAFSCTLLKTSKMPIIKVAEICGIYTIAYFYNSFKAEYGISPSQYRKNNHLYNKLTAHEFNDDVIN